MAHAIHPLWENVRQFFIDAENKSDSKYYTRFFSFGGRGGALDPAVAARGGCLTCVLDITPVDAVLTVYTRPCSSSHQSHRPPKQSLVAGTPPTTTANAGRASNNG